MGQLFDSLTESEIFEYLDLVIDGKKLRSILNTIDIDFYSTSYSTVDAFIEMKCGIKIISSSHGKSPANNKSCTVSYFEYNGKYGFFVIINDTSKSFSETLVDILNNNYIHSNKKSIVSKSEEIIKSNNFKMDIESAKNIFLSYKGNLRNTESNIEFSDLQIGEITLCNTSNDIINIDLEHMRGEEYCILIQYKNGNEIIIPTADKTVKVINSEYYWYYLDNINSVITINLRRK